MPRTVSFALQSVLPVLGLLGLIATQGCNLASPPAEGGPRRPDNQTAAITLTWQRLVDEAGRTCGRCGATEQAIAEAESQLREALTPVGLRVEVRKETISPAAFANDPGESNRIWIDGRPIEDLLGGTVGKSACCDACGDRECRTLIVDGLAHEAISAPLIVRAGLIAAAARLPIRKGEGAAVHSVPGTPSSSGAGTTAPCCASGCDTQAGAATSCCASRPGADAREERTPAR